MKKIIITRDNYEEIMFGLLENAYTREEQDNLLDQIQADTFLSFEWQQWQKATFTESTEFYKQSEAEFLEGLTREEDKRGGLVIVYRQMAIAASLILLLGVSVLLYKRTSTHQEDTKLMVNNTIVQTAKDTVKSVLEVPVNHTVKSAKTIATLSKATRSVTIDTAQQMLPVTATVKQEAAIVIVEENRVVPNVSKPSRYKVSISEEAFTAPENSDMSFKEKRYTMADVLSKKDGISLSKFLDNASKQIVEDKITHITYIEYTAADQSVLVVPLTN